MADNNELENEETGEGVEPEVKGIDLDDGNDDFEAEEEEEAPKNKERYSDTVVETAVIANPKRAQARKASRIMVEGIMSDAELDGLEGQEEAWKALSEKADLSVSKDYTIQAELVASDVVTHPTFGTGYVIEELSPTKVSVLFADGIRKLVCNLS